VTIVEFPDHNAARRNNELPETQRLAERRQAVATSEPRFWNLDEVRRTED